MTEHELEADGGGPSTIEEYMCAHDNAHAIQQLVGLQSVDVHARVPHFLFAAHMLGSDRVSSLYGITPRVGLTVMLQFMAHIGPLVKESQGSTLVAGFYWDMDEAAVSQGSTLQVPVPPFAHCPRSPPLFTHRLPSYSTTQVLRLMMVWFGNANKTKVTKQWDSDSVEEIVRILGKIGPLGLQRTVAQHHKANCVKWMPSSDQFINHAKRALLAINTDYNVLSLERLRVPLIGWLAKVEKVAPGLGCEEIKAPTPDSLDSLRASGRVFTVQPDFGCETPVSELFLNGAGISGNELAGAVEDQVKRMLGRLCGKCRHLSHGKKTPCSEPGCTLGGGFGSEMTCTERCSKCLHAPHGVETCPECKDVPKRTQVRGALPCVQPPGFPGRPPHRRLHDLQRGRALQPPRR